MTSEELSALPESGGIGYREEIRDGRRIRIPVMNSGGALWQKPDDGVVIDESGQRWLVGWMKGVRYRQRMSSL